MSQPFALAIPFAVLRRQLIRWSEMRFFGQPTSRLLLSVLALVGFVVLFLVVKQIWDRNGIAVDAHAYWLAGQRVWDQQPLYYAETIIAPYRAFLYLPVFAHLFALPALLPEQLFVALYLIICLASVAYMVEWNWRYLGLILLFPPLHREILVLNVTLPIAAISVAALRHSRIGQLALPAAAATKWGPAIIVLWLWFCQPATRRPLLVGTAILLLASAVSVLIYPQAWPDFIASLLSLEGVPVHYSGLIALTNSARADFVIRAVPLSALAVLAIRQRNAGLIFLISILLVPTLWHTRIAALPVLLLLPPLRDSDWRLRADVIVSLLGLVLAKFAMPSLWGVLLIYLLLATIALACWQAGRITHPQDGPTHSKLSG